MGYSVSINELVEIIISVSKKNLNLRNDLSKPDIPTALSLDCSKAKREIGWENSTEFIEAIKETFNWAKKNYG